MDPERPTPQKSFLLKNWPYIWLSVFCIALYSFMLLHRSKAAHYHADIASHSVAEKVSFAELELSASEFVEKLRSSPEISVLVSLWALIMLLLMVSGVFLSISFFKRKSPLYEGHGLSDLSRLWVFSDFLRILIMTICVMSLIPPAHISAGALFPAIAGDKNVWSLLAMLFLDTFVVFLIVSLVKAKGFLVVSAMGLRSRDFSNIMGSSIKSYITLLPWLFGLLWVIAFICERIGIRPPIEPIQELLFLEERDGVIWLTVFLACLVGPVAEEVFFRGLLFSALRPHLSFSKSMLISAAAFSALHTNVVGFIPIMALGCLLAYLYEKSGSLLGPISVHIFHNSLLMGLGLTLKQVISLSP